MLKVVDVSYMLDIILVKESEGKSAVLRMCKVRLNDVITGRATARNSVAGFARAKLLEKINYFK